MSKVPAVILPTLFLAFSSAAIPAGADPIRTSFDVRVVSGSMQVMPGTRSECCREPEAGPSGSMSLTGDPAVHLTAGGRVHGVPCDFGCDPGALAGAASLTAVLAEGTVSDIPGQFGPIDFDELGVSGGLDGGSLDFTFFGSAHLPESAGTFSLTQPFTFLGALTVPGFLPPTSPDGDPTAVPIDFTFNGRGTATTSFVRGGTAEGRDVFFFDGMRLEFTDPVPEPASMVLFGTGAAFIMRRSRRGMRRQD